MKSKDFIRFFRVVAACIFLAALFLISACTVETGVLSGARAAAIRQAYYEQEYEAIEKLEELTGLKITPDELVESMDYLGNYNGYDVVLVKLSILEGVSDSVLRIDGVEIGIFGAGKQIDCYSPAENSLESLARAYEAGKIGKSDLRTIKRVCKQQGYSKKEAVAI